uniref:CSON011882 protein n=1 Tax=Culicoides sonorensis TaxID=179676 RepID=A0A336KJN6_CULSO
MRQLLIICLFGIITTSNIVTSRQIIREEHTDSSRDVSSSEQQYMVDHFESTRLSRNRTKFRPSPELRGENVQQKNSNNKFSNSLVNNKTFISTDSNKNNNKLNDSRHSSNIKLTTYRPKFHSILARTRTTSSTTISPIVKELDSFSKQIVKRKKPDDSQEAGNEWTGRVNGLNDYDDDEADPDFLPLSAGNGKEKGETPANDDDSKKTLSDQVKEGKYGLIQNELFQEIPKRPGVISYKTNPETKKDNKDTLGGLQQEDIWLAENSLLVLKGGDLNTKQNDEPWIPIDGYKAEKRPIKIPSNPKVPPPFPVQLDEDGPVQFLGNNPFPVFNPFTNESINLLAPNGLPQAEPYFKNFPFPLPPPENLTNTFIPPPLLDSLVNPNKTFINPFINFPPPPFGPPFDPSNMTEFDEDDPSLYYPPPYSFVYKSNYSNLVPPGPLVPGIVLPPPPNFFTRLNDSKPKPPGKTTQDVITRLQKINGRTKLYTTTLRPTLPSSGKTSTGRTVLKPKQPQISVEISKAKVRGPIEPIKDFDRFNYVKPTGTPIQQSTTTTLKPTTVYYNYFEAKEPSSTTKRPKTNGRPMTYKEIVRKPSYESSTTTKKPHLKNTYLPSNDYDKYVYITPKPEIRNNGRPTTENYDYVPISNIQFLPSKQSQLQSFEREIETIKQTLRYYKTTTPSPRITSSTSRPVYEYSFETRNNNDYGFKPIIPNYAGYYQEPVTDAPQYYPSTTVLSPYVKHKKPKGGRGHTITQTLYDSSSDATTEYPVYPSTRAPYYVPKYHHSSSTQNPHAAAIVSIEKQILRELIPQTGAIPHSNFNSNNNNQQSSRFNQYYQPQQQQQQQQPQQIYYDARKPLERVVIGNQTYIVYRIKSPSPRPFQAQNPSYNTNQQRPRPSAPLRQHSQQYQQFREPTNGHQQPITLDSDINVNYRHPLPPINPDSEFIPSYNPGIVQNTGSSSNYQRDPNLIQYKLPGDQAHVYFLPPNKR